MVEDKFKQAWEFRGRAEQLLEIARGLTRQTERQLLTQLAEEYDEMARSAAAIAKDEVARATADGVRTLDETAARDHWAGRSPMMED